MIQSVLKSQQYEDNNPTLKCGKYLYRDLSRTDTQMPKKHMGKWSTSIICGEVQINTTMRYSFTLMVMATFKETDNTSTAKNMENLEP